MESSEWKDARRQQSISSRVLKSISALDLRDRCWSGLIPSLDPTILLLAIARTKVPSSTFMYTVLKLVIPPALKAHHCSTYYVATPRVTWLTLETGCCRSSLKIHHSAHRRSWLSYRGGLQQPVAAHGRWLSKIYFSTAGCSNESAVATDA